MLSRRNSLLIASAVLGIVFLLQRQPGSAQNPADSKAAFTSTVRPLLKKFCLDCHSAEAMKGSLDLERFETLDHVRKEPKVWQQVIEQLEADEMPPKKKPQPTAEERKRLVEWTRGMLEAEARARAGDPGFVPLRRLSNTEYDCTIRDLTGVDLRPTREFPADGAAGEGFTNAAEALSDVSPTLLNKYLNAAKQISEHAVMTPDGFRFSPSTSRRDWTDECNDKLRKFFAGVSNPDGTLPLQPYLTATVKYRADLLSGKQKLDEVAAREKLNAKYLGILWKTLTDSEPSEPLNAIRARWRDIAEKDVPALLQEITGKQNELWKVARVGSYVRSEGVRYFENYSRQYVDDPPAVETVPLRLGLKPTPGQSEVVVYLTSRELSDGLGQVTWQRPRFEGDNKPPLLLKDYADFGPAFEVEYPTLFAASEKYLAAVVEMANDPKSSAAEVARKHGLDSSFLKRWAEVLAVAPYQKDASAKTTPAVPLELLADKWPGDPSRPAVKGWRKKGTDLPVLIANASDQPELIPGRVPAHGVSMHPTPKEFVAVVWKSPTAGNLVIEARIAHAHPACGNGVAWFLEQRRDGRAMSLGEGNIDLGKETKPAPFAVKIEKGDQLVLAVDARDGNHVCDMTEVAFAITETEGDMRTWDLGKDTTDSIHAGNPHTDKFNHAETWSFAFGPSKGSNPSDPLIPMASVLGRWRVAASDPDRKAETVKLAEQAKNLLSGQCPAKDGNPDRLLYDRLVGIDSPLFKGVELVKLATPRKGPVYGLPREKFDKDGNLSTPSTSVTEIRLPAALFSNRELVIEGKAVGSLGDRAIRLRVGTTPQGREDGPVLATPAGAGYCKLIAGRDRFRSVFPLVVCFPNVVPTDEVVCLKMFHREDEPLARLFLSDEQQKQLSRLWDEHRFVSRQPVAEEAYLPQFIGFVTQDQPKEMVTHFEGQRKVFHQRTETFLKEEEAAIPRQIDALLEFAGRAYRRPLKQKERDDLTALYRSVRGKGASHEEAVKGVMTRILISPAFLFRVENAPAGKESAPVGDWELATRLSYFLWSSLPDEPLRKLASEGKLRDPQVLLSQVERMLKDEKLRSLAVEFGTQWIHVRGFDDLKEKSEKLFPNFDANLRKAIYEESILFFQDLFQGDRPVMRILDADYTFLNEPLAKHYGIPDVKGPEFRRVEGVRKYGRGGVLGLASVQAKQSGASRSSPTLRGNWVVETLLGEKLPRPPANVPRLPEEEGDGGLSVRQLVEKHALIAECAACHVRIDPFGFALEKYDPIGRFRDKDLAGIAIDAKSKLRDGSAFDGIDGLRDYLLTKKKEVIVRLFCKRLLGYALGRSVTLSDTLLLDEMVAELNKNEGKVSAAVRSIVRSPQFRNVRGADFAE